MAYKQLINNNAQNTKKKQRKNFKILKNSLKNNINSNIEKNY